MSGTDFKHEISRCRKPFFEICTSQTRNAPYLVVSSKITPSELAALTPRAKKMKLVSPKWVLDSVERTEIQDPAVYQPISPVVNRSQRIEKTSVGTNSFDTTMEMTTTQDKKVQEKDENQDPNAVSFEEMIAEKRRKQKERLNEMQNSPAGKDLQN